MFKTMKASVAIALLSLSLACSSAPQLSKDWTKFNTQPLSDASTAQVTVESKDPPKGVRMFRGKTSLAFPMEKVVRAQNAQLDP